MNKRIAFAVSVAALWGIGVCGLSFAKETPAAALLRPDALIKVSAAPNRFDLLSVDKNKGRLLAAHSKAGTLTVIDLKNNKLIAEIPVGDESSHASVDQQDGKYFVGTDKGVAVVDSKTLKKTGFIKTPGPADAMVLDPKNYKLYVGHDDGKELWVIDARQEKIVSSIKIPGAPELLSVDPYAKRLYVNIKPLDEVLVINTATDKTVATWPTKPTVSPHGLVLDKNRQRLYVAGRSAMVSIFSLPKGAVLNAINIGPGHVDQIAFDDKTGRLYCPNNGRLVVIEMSGQSGSVLGSVPIPKGTHSVAVDPATHKVWIAYADDHNSYVQAFAP